MPTYICLQRSFTQANANEHKCASESQDSYAKFVAWQRQFQNNIVDLGGKLGSGKRATTEGVTDGPFVESKEVIGGYMILSAENLDEAVEIASGIPGLISAGSGFDIFEIHKPG